MATLREFLSDLATDATRLGEFILDPDASMSGAELSEADKAALRSGFANVIAARLAGLPAQEAFAATLQAPSAAGLFPSLQISPLQIVPPLQLPLQITPPQIVPPLQLPLQITPPQIVPPLQLPPLQFPPQISPPLMLQFPPPQLPPQIVPPLMLQLPPPPLMLQQLFPPPPPPQISPLQFPPLQLPPLQFPPPQLLALGQAQGYPGGAGYGSPYYGGSYYGRGW